MTEATDLLMPGGLLIDDKRLSVAAMRSLNGSEEQLLDGPWAQLSLPEKTSVVLQRSLQGIGTVCPVSLDLIRGLCLGDREALMLHLRRLTLGNRILALFSCPNPKCKESLSQEINVRDLLLPPYSHWQKCYESHFSSDGKVYCIRFRLPNGYDQERAALTATRLGIIGAADELIKGCILGVWQEDGSTISSIPNDVALMLSSRMAELDPQAELLLKLSCPSCGENFESLFDAASFFFQEIATMSGLFYYDVHMMAFNYHWPMKEIMELNTMMRRRYVQRLEDHLRGDK